MLRSQEEIESFFGDFELVDPGLEQIHRWRRTVRLPPFPAGATAPSAASAQQPVPSPSATVATTSYA
jgi:hypothetical protein